MSTLEEYAGLPVDLAGARIAFRDQLPAVEPAVRRREEMREVLADPLGSGPDELYYMYRGVGYAADREALTARGLRYDITVLRPGTVGTEYIKTAGHYHSPVPGGGPPGWPAKTEFTYPELYEVLHGVAHYLLQRVNQAQDLAEDVILVEARPGDRLLVPPGYGHITINPGREPLVMCNLVEATFRSVYDPIKRMKGGAYYEVLEGGRPIFVSNETYRDVAELRSQAPTSPEVLGVPDDTPLYRLAVADPERFAYLVHPRDFRGEWIAG